MVEPKTNFLRSVRGWTKSAPQKNCFLWLNYFELALGMTLNIYNSVAKGLKLKVRKLFGANSYVCRSYREKMIGGGFFAPLSWIGLKIKFQVWIIQNLAFVSFEQTLDEILKINPKKHLRLQTYQSLSSKEIKMS